MAPVVQTCAFCGEVLGEGQKGYEFRSWFHLTFRCPNTTEQEKADLKKAGWR